MAGRPESTTSGLVRSVSGGLHESVSMKDWCPVSLSYINRFSCLKIGLSQTSVEPQGRSGSQTSPRGAGSISNHRNVERSHGQSSMRGVVEAWKIHGSRRSLCHLHVMVLLKESNNAFLDRKVVNNEVSFATWSDPRQVMFFRVCLGGSRRWSVRLSPSLHGLGFPHRPEVSSHSGGPSADASNLPASPRPSNPPPAPLPPKLPLAPPRVLANMTARPSARVDRPNPAVMAKGFVIFAVRDSGLGMTVLGPAADDKERG